MSKHVLKFYPLGNADTTLITLSDGRHILWDYANKGDKEDPEDKRCDLPVELAKDVKEGQDYEVVTFTHADDDHIHGFSDYFHLEHADKYQGDGRKKIGQLWVPATVLMDTEAKDEAKILKMEARYRLKNKRGILVFSRPERLKQWCDQQEDISYDDVKHLVVDTGKPVPGFEKEKDGVEFFVHAPFLSESEKLDRNGASIVVQATFNDRCNTQLILGGDCTHEVWKDIVTITKAKGNSTKLEWDIFHISHHSSYLSLSSEKGVDKTVPVDEIKWLFENQGARNARLISPSKPEPTKGSKEDVDNNPPHRQACAYYREDVAEPKNGEYIITMEYPSKDSPEPIVIEVDRFNCSKLIKKAVTSSVYISTKPSPRAGHK